MMSTVGEPRDIAAQIAGSRHPRRDDDRYARFGLNDGNVSPRAPFGIQLPDLAAMQRVPAVMDFNIPVDMGRMTPR
jgi:hypothetical protein